MTTQDKLADALLAAKYPHIPCAKYDDLLDFHFAVGGEGPLAYEWSDKPHRLVFRLTTELSELRDSIAAIAAAPQPAPEECFCDRMYPDSNPNASCGDCPTRDYAPNPAPTADGADELEQAELWVANHCHEPAMEKTLFSAIAALRQPVPDAVREDVLIRQLRGRAAFLRNRGRVKSPALMEEAASRLESAIASQQESRNG